MCVCLSARCDWQPSEWSGTTTLQTRKPQWSKEVQYSIWWSKYHICHVLGVSREQNSTLLIDSQEYFAHHPISASGDFCNRNVAVKSFLIPEEIEGFDSALSFPPWLSCRRLKSVPRSSAFRILAWLQSLINLCHWAETTCFAGGRSWSSRMCFRTTCAKCNKPTWAGKHGVRSFGQRLEVRSPTSI